MENCVSSPCVVDIFDPSLKGLSALNQSISIFDFGNVAVTKNYKETSTVRLVSGGSLCHTDYVGQGMLTASIQGIPPDPPTPNLILRVIRELSINHVKGILVIVQASSTDVLNFGLAVERAVNDDLRVMFLGVSEDCKNKEFNKDRKRGLSGVILINKIGGAMAEKDKTLTEMYEFCKKCTENMSSTCVNVKEMLVRKECVYCKRCLENELEYEPNSKKVKQTFPDIASNIIKILVNDVFTKNDSLKCDRGDSAILLVNNLNAMTKSEEYLFAKTTIQYFTTYGINIARFYIGNFLELNYDIDLTLTMVKVFDKEILDFLDASCNVPGWKVFNQSALFLSLDNTIPGRLKRKNRLSPPVKGPKLRDRPSNVLQLCLQFACDALISCEKMLNKIDSQKGDGDTGTRLKNVAEVLHTRIKNMKLVMSYPFTFFLSLSKILESAVGGTMGCLYSIVFEAAANKFGEYKEEDDVTPEMWLEALENSCEAIKKYGNVDLGDRTMYDPLQSCASAIRQELIEDEEQYITAFGLGVSKAEEAAQNTRKPGDQHPDPGAHAVGIWMRAIFEGVKLRCSD